MARVTVEDCLLVVPNKFELVLLASKRAKDIDRGAVPSVSKDNDKATIIALREIAGQTISVDALRELTKESIGDSEPAPEAEPQEEIVDEISYNVADETAEDSEEYNDNDEYQDGVEEAIEEVSEEDIITENINE